MTPETTITSNEFYGFLNDRIDRREKELIALGYRRETLSAYNLALYVRSRHGRTHAVQTGTMIHACERAWNDVIDECRRFCESY